jgi:hypothetical protein
VTLHKGRIATGEHLESDLVQFIDELRDEDNDCTVELVVFEILKLDDDFKGGI